MDVHGAVASQWAIHCAGMLIYAIDGEELPSDKDVIHRAIKCVWSGRRYATPPAASLQV
jgi:hypothetical protein